MFAFSGRFPRSSSRLVYNLNAAISPPASATSRTFSSSSRQLIDRRVPRQRSQTYHLKSSSSSILLGAALICGGVIVSFTLYPRRADTLAANPLVGADCESGWSYPSNDLPAMPADDSAGHLGHLTLEEEAKLRQLWAATFDVFAVANPFADPPSTEESSQLTRTDTNVSSKDDKKSSKKRFGVFSRSHRSSLSSTNGSATSSPSSKSKASAADENDKYGQTAEFLHTLSTQSPEDLRSAFWSMVKKDHPDALLLRFLRARKWDVQKALVMLVSTMHWRLKIACVDSDIMLRGEGGAVRDTKSSDTATKKEAEDFLQQMRIGKSFMHGTDRQGRPLCLVRVRLHHGGEQSAKSIERFTVFTIETGRLMLRPPVETACIIFDMTNFTLANMDYAPVKFMIKCFEANYPESLGAVLVHKAPWIFNAIWKIIRGWLDPVVAAKVHFTNSVADMEEFIPRSQILKELGGDEDWDYKYVEPLEGEDRMLLSQSHGEEPQGEKARLLAERETQVSDFQRDTWEWIQHGEESEGVKAKVRRDEIAGKLREGYWKIDPWVRARSWYDRTGLFGEGGKLTFYGPKPGPGSTHTHTHTHTQNRGLGARVDGAGESDGGGDEESVYADAVEHPDTNTEPVASNGKVFGNVNGSAG